MTHSKIASLFAVLLLLLSAPAIADDQGPVPVILDSDIGDDIDDTWALGLLLKSPDVDLKLVLGTWGKHLYRARLSGKFLEAAGRSDVAIGIGPARGGNQTGRQSAWIGNYRLADYPGPVHQDGIQAMIDLIMQSPVTVTVVAVGPLANIAEALRREPRIAGKVRLITMMGSISKDYAGNTRRFREYNAHADPKASQKALTAAWPITVTPADSVHALTLTGRDYRRIVNSDDPVAKAIIENYRVWLKPGAKHLIEKQSSTLFDSLAVYLTTEDDYARIETLRLRVTPDGHTVLDPSAREMQVATGWKNVAGFRKTISQMIAEDMEPRDRGRWFGGTSNTGAGASHGFPGTEWDD